MQNALKMKQQESCTQFELTSNIITKLNNFNLTPTAKLVLLYLTTCYNPKHKEVFPKQKTIADKLGISERSVTRAVQELFKEGLVLIECKYTNRYKFTSKIVSQQAEILSDDLRQNDIIKNDKLSVPYIRTNKHEQIKQQNRVNNQSVKIYTNSKSGENVYTGDDLILYEYAKKKAKYSVDAFIRKIKENGGDKKIINEYKKKNASLGMAYNYNASLDWLKQQDKENQLPACTAVSIGFSLSDLKKRGILK